MNINQIQTKSKIERLEARLTKQQKDLIQRAADIQGRTVSDFIITVAQKEAQQVIREHEVISLSTEASRKFVDLLLNPPEPNEYLRKAYEDSKKYIIDET
jgi:uncharacterized protein (DUF1778 family)